MKQYIKDNTYITEYPSLTEFLNAINSLPNNKYFKDRHSSQRPGKTDDDYYGTTDYQQATYMLTHGWDSAAKKMATKVKMTTATSNVVRTTKPSYGVVGTQASVPRYLQGIPTNMVSRQTTYSKQKVVTITKSISYSSRWTTKEILDECVKALTIIQSMENGGQRVRLNVLVAVTSTTDRKYSSICKVCVKQPDERLNISKMSFALAHPSMLRRFFLKWMETETFTPCDIGPFYGTPAALPIIKDAMSEQEYYLPESIPDVEEFIKQINAK